jgi:ATP-dependent DNA helicase RecG
MRPSLLDPLFVPITSLAGVGPKVGALIEKVVAADLGDRAASRSARAATPWWRR